MPVLYYLYQHPPLLLGLLALISLWELLWKGIGLWYASRNKQKVWFVVLLFLNTVGLLPIIYLIWFKPKKKELVVGPMKEGPSEKRKTKSR